MTNLWLVVTAPTVAENTIKLYRLLVANKDRPFSFDEARDRLGFTNHEMRQAVDLLNEVFDEPDFRGVAVV